MADLPARYAIHRASQPRDLPQFAGVANDGRLAWLSGWTAALDFGSAQAAHDFVHARMGDHAADAKVERHTIH